MNRYDLSEAYVGGPTGEIGPGKHRRLGGDGGGSSPTTSVTTPSIPNELKPLANLYTNQATQYANTPFQNYGGQRYAGLDPTQQAGLGMVENRALGGNQTMRNAETGVNQFIQGGQTNPFLDKMVNKAQGSVADNFNTMVKPQTETAMRQSGSFGNSGLQETMQRQQKAAGQQMSDIATQMYGQAYGQDQGNRLQAIGMAPTFGNAAYQDAGQLINAGNIRQQSAQNPLDFQYSQFKDRQDYPLKQMQATSGVLGSRMGSSTTGTAPSGGK